MTLTTHFLASWSSADLLRLRGRDQALVTWCGLLPDADGLGIFVDQANRLLGRPETWYYGQYHHALLHGMLGAFILPLVISIFAARRLHVFAVGVLVVHLHLLCDIVGSRGPRTTDVWEVSYLAPFSEGWTIEWAGQWPLDSWPNIAFTLILVAFAIHRAMGAGRSPMSAFGCAADHAFLILLRRCRQTLQRSMGS